MPNAVPNLDEEYKLVRASLLRAGLDMSGSIDALYRDWRRWRDKSYARSTADLAAASVADQWWARHLEQFRALIDRPHVAARAERVRKDQAQG
ncbi:MAG TPA: hypothetical protein VKS22_15070 [Candidatus Binataceae bacterium]|nr:hypothetical protein [Candidatus Binataceae bacterium]